MMKTIYLTTLIVCFTLSLCYSQDTIITNSNGNIIVKVVKVTKKEIKYKKIDNPNMLKPYSILKSDVLMVRYQNGKKNDLNPPKQTLIMGNRRSTDTIYNPFLKGAEDAIIFYHDHQPERITLILSIIGTPVAGFFSALVYSITPVKQKNLAYPSETKMNNKNYRLSYKQTAKKIKTRKVWSHLGIVTGIELGLFLLIYLPRQT